MANLDNIDKILLNNLQKNGRITNVELAENAGISAPPCLRRLKLMENKNIITGYHADINPTSLGYFFRAICIVSLKCQSSVEVKKFLDSVSKSENIRSCFSTSGNENFILTIVAKNLQDYERILKKEIQSNKALSSVKTYITLNKHKDDCGLPIEI